MTTKQTSQKKTSALDGWPGWYLLLVGFILGVVVIACLLLTMPEEKSFGLGLIGTAGKAAQNNPLCICKKSKTTKKTRKEVNPNQSHKPIHTGGIP